MGTKQYEQGEYGYQEEFTPVYKTDQYTVYRLAVPCGGREYTVWRDGLRVAACRDLRSAKELASK